jgi:hypothetical protein
MDWRPIRTAPKDEWVLIRSGNAVWTGMLKYNAQWKKWHWQVLVKEHGYSSARVIGVYPREWTDLKYLDGNKDPA